MPLEQNQITKTTDIHRRFTQRILFVIKTIFYKQNGSTIFNETETQQYHRIITDQEPYFENSSTGRFSIPTL